MATLPQLVFNALLADAKKWDKWQARHLADAAEHSADFAAERLSDEDALHANSDHHGLMVNALEQAQDAASAAEDARMKAWRIQDRDLRLLATMLDDDAIEDVIDTLRDECRHPEEIEWDRPVAEAWEIVRQAIIDKSPVAA